MSEENLLLACFFALSISNTHTTTACDVSANVNLTACPQSCGAAAATTCQSFDYHEPRGREPWGSGGVQSGVLEAGKASKSWDQDHLQVTEQARSEASLRRGGMKVRVIGGSAPLSRRPATFDGRVSGMRQLSTAGAT